MFSTKLEEIVVKKNQTISLKGVVKIIFDNTGSNGCRIGLKELEPSKKRTISADGNFFDSGELDIKFNNNSSGFIHIEIIRFYSCEI